MVNKKFVEHGPQPVKDDPYAELFADCTTPEEVLELQAEIEAAEADE